jgi:hypothetical protein
MRRGKAKQEAEQRFLMRQDRLRERRQRKNTNPNPSLSQKRDGHSGDCSPAESKGAAAGFFSAVK